MLGFKPRRPIPPLMIPSREFAKSTKKYMQANQSSLITAHYAVIKMHLKSMLNFTCLK